MRITGTVTKIFETGNCGLIDADTGELACFYPNRENPALNPGDRVSFEPGEHWHECTDHKIRAVADDIRRADAPPALE